MSILFSTQQRLIEDEIRADLINPALAGDSEAIGEIGRQYLDKKQYGEAIKWFRLAAAKNNSGAQNDIGVMYYEGLGVPINYVAAMEWFLKAAVQKHKVACGNIGNLFEYGSGVPVDKHRALEWYIKCGNKPEEVRGLEDQGFQLTEEDKGKGVEYLIIEAENILWNSRNETREVLKHQIIELEEQSNARDVEIMSLKDKIKKVEEAIADENDQLDNFLRVGIDKFKKNEEKIKRLEQQSKSLTEELNFFKNVNSKRRKLQ